MLQNITGRQLSSILEMTVLQVTSLVIAFYYSWKITLVSLIFLPILVFAGAFEVSLLALFWFHGL